MTGFSIYLVNDLSIVKEGKITKVTSSTYTLNDEIVKADERLQGKANEDGTYNLEDLINYYYQRYIGQEENAGTLPENNQVYYLYDIENEHYVLDYKNNAQGEEITIFSIKTGTSENTIVVKMITIPLLASIAICFMIGIEILVLKRKK